MDEYFHQLYSLILDMEEIGFIEILYLKDLLNLKLLLR
uniref:Uncharacterized protein n=1 Tax=virus sp. ctrcb4 TaxID=2825824 RepID=A0A8S5RP80_9VIRU|nr:MAG TPA: hypothetical protein [virus sp. ctrcb4]DAR12763.1 MAG TPA: hypothetical protein [Crassvirales sp.]